MPGRAQLGKTYSWALVVDEQQLRRLADECQRVVLPDGSDPSTVALHLEVLFSDGLTLTLDSLDDLLREENPKRRAITGLEMKTEGSLGDVTIQIGRASRAKVAGQDRQWVYVTFTKIEDRLRRMKQWYPRVAPIVAGTVFVGAVSLVVLITRLSRRYPDVFEGVNSAGQRAMTVWGAALVIPGLALIALIGYVTYVLFKDPVFRIGDGVERHDRIKKARAWIASVLGLTIGLGLFLQWLGRQLW